jgi:hypothetical protein
MLAKKELQWHQPIKMKTSFMPRSAPTAPSRTAMTSGAHSSTTPLPSHAPSTSSTPSAAAPRATDPSKTFFHRQHQQQSLCHPQFLPDAHRILSATVAMVLATSSETTPARNPTSVQLTEVM